jgi:hypothetical protein
MLQDKAAKIAPFLSPEQVLGFRLRAHTFGLRRLRLLVLSVHLRRWALLVERRLEAQEIGHYLRVDLYQVPQLVEVEERVPVAIVALPDFLDLVLDEDKEPLGDLCVVVFADLLSREEHLDHEEHRQRVSSDNQAFIEDQLCDLLLDRSHIEEARIAWLQGLDQYFEEPRDVDAHVVSIGPMRKRLWFVELLVVHGKKAVEQNILKVPLDVRERLYLVDEHLGSQAKVDHQQLCFGFVLLFGIFQHILMKLAGLVIKVGH